MWKETYRFFDKLEDRVRGWFSHFPIFYAIVGGVGVVLFWRGVWHTVDYFMVLLHAWNSGLSGPDLESGFWWDGPLSFAVGTALLLLIGVFVSNFIGNEIIMSGLRGEKKLTERTEKEVRTEVGAIAEIQEEMVGMSERLRRIEEGLERSKRK